MLSGLVTTFTLLVLGAHVVVPARLARRGPEARTLWTRSALPLLLLATISNLLLLTLQPSSLFEATAAGIEGASFMLFLAGLLLVSLTINDALLLFTGAEVEPLGWKICAGLGAVGLLGLSAVIELSRLLPTAPPPVYLAPITLGRSAVALASGELVAPGRPSWLAPLAAGALLLYFGLLPSEIRTLLIDDTSFLTAAAAAVLFASSRWLPPSLRRAGTGAACLLAGMFFAHVELLYRVLPVLPVYELDVARLTPLVSSSLGS